MASLEEIQPQDQIGPAEQAGIFLEEENGTRPDMTELVLWDSVPPLSQGDPIMAIRKVAAAQREFGGGLEIRANPDGSTTLFVSQEAHDEYVSSEAHRLQHALESLRKPK